MKKAIAVALLVAIGLAVSLMATDMVAPKEVISKTYGNVNLHPDDAKVTVGSEEWVYVVVIPKGFGPITFPVGSRIKFKKEVPSGYTLQGVIPVNLKILKK